MRIRAWLSGWVDIGDDKEKALRFYRNLSMPKTRAQDIFCRHFDDITFEEMQELDREDRKNGNSSKS